MFDGKYLDWNHKKIKTIIAHFGFEYFKNKKIADLGAGHGDIGASLHRLGAEVTCIDAREEHIKTSLKKYPGIKVMKVDLDTTWPYQNKILDMILDLDLVCHLKDFSTHLKNVCSSCNELILETAVSDSDDPNFTPVLNENKSIYDWSFNGFSAFPSAAAIEKILESKDMDFIRFDQKSLNSGTYVYDWKVTNSKECSYNKRRLWFVKKKQAHESPVTHTPAPVLTSLGTNPKLTNPLIKKQEIFSPSPPPINSQKTILQFPYRANTAPDKVRTALCLSGYMRTFELNYEKLWTHVLSQLNCDVFIHTWDVLGNKTNALDSRISGMPSKIFESKINNFYSPKGLVIEPEKEFIHTKLMQDKNDGRSVHNVLSMYYKIKSCNDLKIQYEKENKFKYDCVIRCRPDLNFNNNLDINELTNLDDVFIPKYGDFSGYNDQLAFSNSKNMDIYSSLYDHIEELLDKGSSFNPEVLLKNHLDKQNFKINRPYIKYHILRSVGSIQDNFDLEKKTGHLPSNAILTTDNDLKTSTYNKYGIYKYSDKKDLKIGVCISGHTRMFEQSYKSFLENIMLSNKCDVFMHTWETQGASGGIAADDDIANLKTVDKLPDIKRVINPTKLEIESYAVYDTLLADMEAQAILSPEERSGFRSGHLTSYASMLYSWKKSKTMLEEYENETGIKYDIIIKLRLDEVFTQKIDILNFINGRIYVPNVGQFYDGGMNDQFAIGDNHGIKTYLSLFDYLIDYINNKEPAILRPEAILKYHLRKSKISMMELPIPYYILRSNGHAWYLPKVQQTK